MTFSLVGLMTSKVLPSTLFTNSLFMKLQQSSQPMKGGGEKSEDGCLQASWLLVLERRGLNLYRSHDDCGDGTVWYVKNVL